VLHIYIYDISHLRVDVAPSVFLGPFFNLTDIVWTTEWYEPCCRTDWTQPNASLNMKRVISLILLELQSVVVSRYWNKITYWAKRAQMGPQHKVLRKMCYMSLTEVLLLWLRFYYSDWGFITLAEVLLLWQVLLLWLRFFLTWLRFYYSDWGFITLAEVFLNLTEVLLLWLRFYYSGWGFY